MNVKKMLSNPSPPPPPRSLLMRKNKMSHTRLFSWSNEKFVDPFD